MSLSFRDERRHRFGALFMISTTLAWSGPGLGSAAAQQLNDSCVVSVLNRTVPVRADGSLVLPSVPANLGQARARATCTPGGKTTSGESEFFLKSTVDRLKPGCLPIDRPLICTRPPQDA